MAVRIRKNGQIFCAALRGAEDGDVYVNDGVHYYLSSIAKVLVTEPNEKHMVNAEWWWCNSIPDGVEIDGYYLD